MQTTMQLTLSLLGLSVGLGVSLGLVPGIFADSITSFKYARQDNICGLSQLSGMDGVISSPNYPSVYPNHTSCTWFIISPPKSKLTINVTDFDIEEDTNCNHPPCCQHTWLSLPKGGSRKGSQQYCGSKTRVPSVTVNQNVTFIKFHTSKVNKGGRGFLLKYTISEVPSNELEGIPCGPGTECTNGLMCVTVNGVFLCETPHNVAQKCTAHNMVACGNSDSSCFDNVTQRCDGVQDCLSGVDETNCGSHNCYSDELMCRSGNGCYKIHQKCDMKMDCSDFSDEINCGLCADGLVLCSPVDRRCFSPNLQRCNGKFDCLFGEDEVGCAGDCREDEIACADGGGCYSPSQRCDSARHCHDASDERGCPPCGVGGRLRCDNGRCVAGRRRCDGRDDCGDDSDEQGCLATWVVSAAIAGSLTCGLLAVVAAGVARRLHAARSRPRPRPQPLGGFPHREPPPPYTAALPRAPAPAPAPVRETSLGAGQRKPDGPSPSTASSPDSPSQESGTSYRSDGEDTELLLL